MRRAFNEFGNALYSAASSTDNVDVIGPHSPSSTLLSPDNKKHVRHRAYEMYTKDKMDVATIAKAIGKSEKTALDYICDGAKTEECVDPSNFDLTNEQVKLIQKRLKLFSSDKNVLDTLKKDKITALQVKICRIITLPA